VVERPPTPSNRAGLIIMGLGLVVGLVAGLIVFVGLPRWPAAPAANGGTVSTPAPAPVVGAPAPDFTLEDTQGNAVTLSALKGEVVLVNFWATWCGPCRLEMPDIQRKYDAIKDQGFTVLAVNLDESLEAASGFAAELGLTFPVLLDPGGEVNDLYRVRGWPTTYIINRDGLIERQHVGIMSAGQLDEYLAGLGLEN
jgi:peroxiredoxin